MIAGFKPLKWFQLQEVSLNLPCHKSAKYSRRINAASLVTSAPFKGAGGCFYFALVKLGLKSDFKMSDEIKI